jgi:hypothetical protein
MNTGSLVVRRQVYRRQVGFSSINEFSVATQGFRGPIASVEMPLAPTKAVVLWTRSETSWGKQRFFASALW